MKIAETYDTETEQIDSSRVNENSSQKLNSQTAEFVDANPGEILDFKTSVAYNPLPDDQSTLGLAEFLARPTLIGTHTWTTSAFSTTLNYVWSSFLDNAVIKNKLQNFAYIRGDLKVKLIVNCSPFYYGALIAYYEPIETPTLSSTSLDFVTISQRPHVWIYPQTSSGGELHLPFFYHKNYLPLAAKSEVQNMGDLVLKQYTPLTSANGASSNGCTIQIYAWMENVQLQGNSTAAIMQSGRMRVNDEYGNGPISAPAAILANWADHLRDTPIIGKFATATQIGASAVSHIAKLFGWSNVPVIEDVKPMKNLPFHDLASAHLSEPTTKMTLDPKGEISVDPTIVGLSNADEMTVANIAQHESFLTSATWATTDAVGTQFFIANVTPMLYDRSSASAHGTYSIAMTPMCFVARPFANWRGDIIFRFKVICSRFHQGRLRISWDPVAANSGTTDNTNVILTKIIDLAESDEVEFRVPYMQAAQWSYTTRNIGDLAATPNWTNGAGSKTHYVDTDNGIITVKCLTNLSAPIDTASVQIFCFVRAADNFMVANPQDVPHGFSWIQMQSGVAQADDGALSDEFHKTNFGDPILSIRTLLRRSTRSEVRVVLNTYTGPKRVTMRVGRYPLSPGYDPNGYATCNGVETPASVFAFNPVEMTPMNWFLPAFIASRGSIRWHANMLYEYNGSTDFVDSFSVIRTTDPHNAGALTVVDYSPNSNRNMDVWVNDQTSCGSGGYALTNQKTQTGVAVEKPMNVPYKFVYNKPGYMSIGNSKDGSDYDSYYYRATVTPMGQTTCVMLERYVSAGTDFSLHFFISVPTLYYNATMGVTYS